MMSASSLGLDLSNQFTDHAASRVGTENNRELNGEAIDLRDEVLSTSMFEELVGSSDAICRVTAQVMRVAPSDTTVLITGESGTGADSGRSGALIPLEVGQHSAAMWGSIPLGSGALFGR